MKCLILANIRGNWAALQAVLAAERNVDQILCLGDLVGQEPQSAECVAWAMELNPPSLVVSAAGGLLTQVDGAGTDFLLNSGMRRFLAGLNPFQQFQWDGFSCMACHRVSQHPLDRASFERLEDVHWNSTELARMHSDIILTGIPGKLFVLVGHPDFLFLAESHQALQMELNGTVIINPGSLGLSSGDRLCAAYAIWLDGKITLHRLAHRVDGTVLVCEQPESIEKSKQQLPDGVRTRPPFGAPGIIELAM